jgi:hypothetical protein
VIHLDPDTSRNISTQQHQYAAQISDQKEQGAAVARWKVKRRKQERIGQETYVLRQLDEPAHPG